jgi:hypothetical protein
MTIKKAGKSQYFFRTRKNARSSAKIEIIPIPQNWLRRLSGRGPGGLRSIQYVGTLLSNLKRRKSLPKRRARTAVGVITAKNRTKRTTGLMTECKAMPNRIHSRFSGLSRPGAITATADNNRANVNSASHTSLPRRANSTVRMKSATASVIPNARSDGWRNSSARNNFSCRSC